MVVCLERDLCLSYTLHTLTFSMRTTSVLTPCKPQFHRPLRDLVSTGTSFQRPWSNVKVPHLACKVRYFHVTPLAPHYFDLSSYVTTPHHFDLSSYFSEIPDCPDCPDYPENPALPRAAANPAPVISVSLAVIPIVSRP